MATFEATTHPLAFAHMEGGVKTVYCVPATPDFNDITSGDRLEFDDLGSITLGTVRRYESLLELMEAEGFANVIPEAEDASHAVNILESGGTWDTRAASEHGVLALRVRWAKRKS